MEQVLAMILRLEQYAARMGHALGPFEIRPSPYKGQHNDNIHFHCLNCQFGGHFCPYDNPLQEIMGEPIRSSCQPPDPEVAKAVYKQQKFYNLLLAQVFNDPNRGEYTIGITSPYQDISPKKNMQVDFPTKLGLEEVENMRRIRKLQIQETLVAFLRS